jgi:hypothetical protein
MSGATVPFLLVLAVFAALARNDGGAGDVLVTSDCGGLPREGETETHEPGIDEGHDR